MGTSKHSVTRGNVKALATVAGAALLLSALLIRLIENDETYTTATVLLGLMLLFLGVSANTMAGYLDIHRQQVSEEQISCIEGGILIRRSSGEARVR